MTVPPQIPAVTTSTPVDKDLIDEIHDVAEYGLARPAISRYGTVTVPLASATATWAVIGSGAAWLTRFRTHPTETVAYGSGAIELVAGIWRVSAVVSFDCGALTTGYCNFLVWNTDTGEQFIADGSKVSGNASQPAVVSGSMLIEVGSGTNQIQLAGQQSSGAIANVSANRFDIEFVSRAT